MSELAIKALKEKRQKISAYITDLNTRITRQQRNLAHIDAAIAILSPDNVEGPLPKTHYRKTNYFQRNELLRLVLDALRKAQRPMGATEVTLEVVNAKGLPDSIVTAIVPLVRIILQKQVMAGIVTKSGTNRNTKWAVVSSRQPPLPNDDVASSR